NWTKNWIFRGEGTSSGEFDGSPATITGGTVESLKNTSTGSVTLGSNITTSGGLNVAAGTFTLNGFSMTVGSDLQGTSGATLNASSGTLIVDGNNTSFNATLIPMNITFAGSSTSTIK